MAGATARIIDLNTRRAERVRSEIKIVQPEQAERWLEGNTHNRKLTTVRVNEFIAILKAGEWMLTHQGVAFSDEDPARLIDGQHRLYAIWESKIPAIMQVTYGLPFDTQMVIDQGKPRTTLDVAQIFDAKLPGITQLHIATANRFRVGMEARSSADRMTKPQQLAFMQKHWAAIDFAVTAIRIQKKVKGVASASVLAAIARAYAHVETAILSKFARVLAEGVTTDERDKVVIRLRDWLKDSDSGGDMLARDTFARTERAIDCFARNVPIGRNFIGVTQDIYPIQKRS